MSAQQKGGDVTCPQCGTVVPAASPICWLCFATIEQQSSASIAAGDAATAKRAALATRFSLASLMMVMTLVAVVLGMFSVAPGVGILTVLALVPAGLRYAWELRRLRSGGQATTLTQKLLVFAASLSMVVVAGVSSAIAFSAVCFGGLFAGAGLAPYERYDVLIAGVLIGGAAGAGLAIWLFYRLMKQLAPADAAKPSGWLLIGGAAILIAAMLACGVLESLGFIDFQ